MKRYHIDTINFKNIFSGIKSGDCSRQNNSTPPSPPKKKNYKSRSVFVFLICNTANILIFMIRKKKEIETAINFKTSAVQNNETRQKKLNLFAVKNQKKLYLLYHSLFFFFLVCFGSIVIVHFANEFFSLLFFIHLFIYLFSPKKLSKVTGTLTKIIRYTLCTKLNVFGRFISAKEGKKTVPFFFFLATL